MVSQLKKNARHIGMALSVLLLASAILILLTGYKATGLAVLYLGLGSGIGWGLTWLFTWRSLVKPLNDLSKISEELVAGDSLALSNALASLAQGNLTAHASMDLQPIQVSGSAEVDQITNVLNRIIDHLQESTKEFNTVTDEPCHRLFYVGTDPYMEGRTAAEALGEAINGQGTVAVIIGSAAQTAHHLRRKGFESLLREKFPAVQIVATVEHNNDIERCHTLTIELVKTHPKLAGLYVAEGGCPSGAASALIKAGVAGRIKLVTHDLVDETMRYLAEGVITATIGQDPFAQGHDPVIHLFNHIVSNWTPSTPRLLTSMDIITQANYQQFWQAGRGLIESSAIAKRRAKPIRAAARLIKIAVLGREESHFWDPVRAGVQAAADELSTYNATVEWIRPEERAEQISAEVRILKMDELVRAGYDAIATDVFANELIPAINRAITSGVSVATFNSEPSSLRGMMEMLAQRAQQLMVLSSDLGTSAHTSGQSTRQIATTIQQVATGTTHQSEDVNKTSSFVEQIGLSIAGVAKGAQEQAQAINRASLVTASINTAIEQVAGNARSGVQGAAQTAEAARSGVQTVEATIREMQTIKDKVGHAVQKVREMGRRSEQIDTIVDTIDEIAAQTNLLALNAAIEAARVEAKGGKTVETLLQQHMLGAISLVADSLAAGRSLDSTDLVTLAQLARLEDLSIADENGVIVATNEPGSLGFRFSDDPRHESFAFRALLNQRDGVVIRPIVVRDQDGKPYIYVGVSRRDRSGIVQAGMSADIVYNLGGYSRGFAVVANEVGKLAEHAKASTKEIAVLIRELQKTVNEAVVVMEDGARDVETGSAQAGAAGKSLTAILQIAEAVNQQVKEIAEAVQHMSASSSELVGAMEMVSAVVEENTAATQEMATNSSELTQAVQNIASISEENSAAVEEVSASTEEVLAQVEQVANFATALTEMSQGLQKLVAQFSINAEAIK